MTLSIISRAPGIFQISRLGEQQSRSGVPSGWNREFEIPAEAISELHTFAGKGCGIQTL